MRAEYGRILKEKKENGWMHTGVHGAFRLRYIVWTFASCIRRQCFDFQHFIESMISIDNESVINLISSAYILHSGIQSFRLICSFVFWMKNRFFVCFCFCFQSSNSSYRRNWAIRLVLNSLKANKISRREFDFFRFGNFIRERIEIASAAAWLKRKCTLSFPFATSRYDFFLALIK